jgi:hypothetical protein
MASLVERNVKMRDWMLAPEPCYSARSMACFHHTVDRIDPEFPPDMSKFFRVCKTPSSLTPGMKSTDMSKGQTICGHGGPAGVPTPQAARPVPIPPAANRPGEPGFTRPGGVAPVVTPATLVRNHSQCHR